MASLSMNFAFTHDLSPFYQYISFKDYLHFITFDGKNEHCPNIDKVFGISRSKDDTVDTI
jgi:hypothetical protein